MRSAARVTCGSSRPAARAAATAAATESALAAAGPQRLVSQHQPAQLGHRLGVIVDAHVADDVAPGAAAGLARDDQHPPRLLAAPVAALALSGLECRHQSLGHRSGRAPERLQHGRPDGGAVHHVRLAGDVRAVDVTGLGNARPARDRRGRPRRGHHPHLTVGREPVAAGRAGQRRGGCRAAPQRQQTERAVRRVAERLRGDGANARLDPEGADAAAERLRLDGGSQLTRVRIPGHDRVGHAGSFAGSRPGSRCEPMKSPAPSMMSTAQKPNPTV